VILYVSLFVCQHDSKMNDPKVFKLGIGNDLWIVYRWYDFGVKRSQGHKVQHILNVLPKCRALQSLNFTQG